MLFSSSGRLRKQWTHDYRKSPSIFLSLQRRILYITPEDSLSALLTIYPDYDDDPFLITILTARIQGNACLLSINSCLLLLRQWTCAEENTFLSDWRKNVNRGKECKRKSRSKFLADASRQTTPRNSLHDMRERCQFSHLLLSSLEETVVVAVVSQWEVCGKRVVQDTEFNRKSKEIFLSSPIKGSVTLSPSLWLQCATLLMTLLSRSSMEAAAPLESFVVSTMIRPLIPVVPFSPPCCSFSLFSSFLTRNHVRSLYEIKGGKINGEQAFRSRCRQRYQRRSKWFSSMNQACEEKVREPWNRTSFVLTFDHLRMWSLLYFRSHYAIPYYVWPDLKQYFLVSLACYTSVLSCLREHVAVPRQELKRKEVKDSRRLTSPSISDPLRFTPKREEDEEDVMVALECSEVLICDIIPPGIHASSAAAHCISGEVAKFRVEIALLLIQIIDDYLSIPNRSLERKGILTIQNKTDGPRFLSPLISSSSIPSFTTGIPNSLSPLLSLGCFTRVLNIIHTIVFQLVTFFSDTQEVTHCHHRDVRNPHHCNAYASPLCFMESLYYRYPHQELFVRFLQLWCQQCHNRTAHLDHFFFPLEDIVRRSSHSFSNKNHLSECTSSSAPALWIRLFPRLGDVVEAFSHFVLFQKSPTEKHPKEYGSTRMEEKRGEKDRLTDERIKRERNSASSPPLSSRFSNPLTFAELVETGKLNVLKWGTWLLKSCAKRGLDDTKEAKQQRDHIEICASGGNDARIEYGSREMHVFLFSFWRCWEEWIPHMSTVTKTTLYHMVKPMLDEEHRDEGKERMKVTEKFSKLVRLRQTAMRQDGDLPSARRSQTGKSFLPVPGHIIGAWLVKAWRRTWQRAHYLVLHHQELMAVISVLGDYSERRRILQESDGDPMHGLPSSFLHQKYFEIPLGWVEDVLFHLCVEQLQEALKHPETGKLSNGLLRLPGGPLRIMWSKREGRNEGTLLSSGHRVEDAAAKAVSSLDPFLFSDLAPFLWSLLFRMEVRRGVALLHETHLPGGTMDSLSAFFRSPVLRRAYQECLEIWLFTLSSSMTLEGLQYERRQKERREEYEKIALISMGPFCSLHTEVKEERDGGQPEMSESVADLGPKPGSEEEVMGVRSSCGSSLISETSAIEKSRAAMEAIESPPMPVILSLGGQPVLSAASHMTNALVQSLFIWGTLAHVFFPFWGSASTSLPSYPVIQPCPFGLGISLLGPSHQHWTFEFSTLVLLARLRRVSCFAATLPSFAEREITFNGHRRAPRLPLISTIPSFRRRRETMLLGTLDLLARQVDREGVRSLKAFQYIYRYVCDEVEEWLQTEKFGENGLVRRNNKGRRSNGCGSPFSIFSAFTPSWVPCGTFSRRRHTRGNEKERSTAPEDGDVGKIVSPPDVFRQLSSVFPSLFDMEILHIVQQWWGEYCLVQRELNFPPKTAAFTRSSSVSFVSAVDSIPIMPPKAGFQLLYILLCSRPTETWAAIPHSFLCREWEALMRSTMYSSDVLTGGMPSQGKEHSSATVTCKGLDPMLGKCFDPHLCCPVVVEELTRMHRFLVWSELLSTLFTWIVSVLRYYRSEYRRRRWSLQQNATPSVSGMPSFSYFYFSPLALLEYFYMKKVNMETPRGGGEEAPRIENQPLSCEVLSSLRNDEKDLLHLFELQEGGIGFPPVTIPTAPVLDAYAFFQHGIQPRAIHVSLAIDKRGDEYRKINLGDLWPSIQKRERAICSIIKKFHQ